MRFFCYTLSCALCECNHKLMGSHAHNCKMVKAKSPAKSAPAAVSTLPYPSAKPPAVPTTTLLHESTETSSYVSSQKAKGSVQPILQDRPKRSYLCKIAFHDSWRKMIYALLRKSTCCNRSQIIHCE